MYCLEKNKPSAAWHFINSASHMIQALGLQHNVPAGTERPEVKAQKRSLFWTIYMTEKMLSLRLGRSSTFRDQDITLARPGRERGPSGSFLAELAPSWINIASIQGRIYDDIYSPGALMQPPHIRTSRARALAAELKAAMQHAQDFHVSSSPSSLPTYPRARSCLFPITPLETTPAADWSGLDVGPL